MSEVAWRDVVLPSAPIVGEHLVEALVHIRRRCRLPKLSQQERNVGVEFDIVRRYFEEIFLSKKADAGVDSSTCLPLAIDLRVDCANLSTAENVVYDFPPLIPRNEISLRWFPWSIHANLVKAIIIYSYPVQSTSYFLHDPTSIPA